MAAQNSGKGKFASLLLLFQGILLILYVVFVDYGEEIIPSSTNNSGDLQLKDESQFAVFQETHVMVVLGFGLLMTFLRRYSHGSLAHTFLIAGLVIEWATLLQGFFNLKNSKIHLKLERMVSADYATAAVLVTFGALLGKVNSLQLLTIALIETFFFSINEGLATKHLFVSDSGGTMFVHVFGAFFGIVVARVLYNRRIAKHHKCSSSYMSDTFALLGTIVLWVYWPSFNCVGATGVIRHRALVNTFYALASSCVSTYAFTVLSSPRSKFNMIQIQNATLSGGIAIGALSQLILQPWGALLIGVVSALISVISYRYILPKLQRRLKIHDSRGVLAVHGFPGLLGALGSIIAATTAKYSSYKTSLYKIYPARAPVFNSTEYIQLHEFASQIPAGLGRSAGKQAVFQLAGLVMSVGVAAIGGLIAGLVIRQSFFDPLHEEDAYEDEHDYDEQSSIEEEEYFDDESDNQSQATSKHQGNHLDHHLGEPV